MCWFGDPLPSKAYRVGALNLGGYGTRSHLVGYRQTTLASWRPFRLARAEDKLSSSFRLPLDFLEGVLAFSFLFLSLNNCKRIYLRVSIDSYWVRIILSCFLWTWACYSKHPAISLEVPAIYLSLIHIWRCRRSTLCRSRWSPYH